MLDPAVVLLSSHDSVWKHVAPHLSGIQVVMGGSKGSPGANYAVVGHGDGGRRAQQLALDGGARAMILMGCGALPGREHELGMLDIPVMLLWGEDDIIHPVEIAYHLDQVFHRSVLAVVPACGNDLPEQEPDTVGALIADFLRTQWLGIHHGFQHGPVTIPLKPPGRPPA
jgi:pimeloyl-ACP methyl ester carboxylesterase